MPSASKYEFTRNTFMPSGSGGTWIWVWFSATAMICTPSWLKLSIALPPQAVAGMTRASTWFAQMSARDWGLGKF